jgi:hypothetical protein
MTHTDSDSADVLWACTRKKAYPSEEIAKLGVASIVKGNPGAEVRPYACRRCGLWHVGATPMAERKYSTFSDDDDHSPLSRVRPPRRRSYGSATVRRTRSVPQRVDRRDEYDD